MLLASIRTEGTTKVKGSVANVDHILLIVIKVPPDPR